MFVRLVTATAALALMSGVAMAQSTAPATPDPNAAAPADQQMPAAPAPATQMPPADPSAATTMPADPGMAAPPSAATGTATDTASRASSLPPEQQTGLKAGDANVTSNAPIADTPENRKLYGKPLSNAGKRSAPNGN